MKKFNTENRFLLTLKDEDIKRIKTNISDSTSVNKGIRIKIEATHSGIVNGNKKLYLPVGMKAGTDSFILPYPKPVTVNHDPHVAPIGRVHSAKYVSYGIGGTIDTLRPVGAVDEKSMAAVRKFVKSAGYKKDGYKGLGHVELIADITDMEAIEKISDRRYLTVSIGGASKAIYCSICGVDNKQKYCDHYPGQIYDGEECFFVSGDLMDFDHVSYVNSPADKNTNTELLDSDDYRVTILDFIELDKGTKMNLKDFLQGKFPTYKEVQDHMTSIGIGAHANADIANIKPLDFIISDESIFPIHDKAHAIAARLILADAEISDDDKNTVLEIIDEKLGILIGDKFSLSDELEKLKTPPVEPAHVTDSNGSNPQISISDETVNAIVQKMVDEIKKSFNVSDSYSSGRLKSIQKVNDSLELEVQSLTEKLRKNTINQILTLEDKMSDNEYRQKLEGRNIASLEDKLEDLINNKSTKLDPENVEDNKLNPGSLDKTNVSGDVVEDNQNNNDNQNTDTNTNNKLSASEIIDEYKTLVRTKGISAARAYFKNLRDEDKIPDNFTFNGV